MSDSVQYDGERSPNPPTDDVNGGSGFSEAATLLRITTERWHTIAPAPPLKATATAIGAWLLLAWGRFGFQGMSSPRALTRFVLIGVYGWLAIAAVTWLGALLLSRSDSGRQRPDPERIIQVTGLSHQPLLVFGVLLQIGQIIPIPGLMTGVAVLTLGLWAPAMLAAALGSVLGPPRRDALLVMAAAIAVWFVVSGRFLLAQLGHLF